MQLLPPHVEIRELGLFRQHRIESYFRRIVWPFEGMRKLHHQGSNRAADANQYPNLLRVTCDLQAYIKSRDRKRK
jgi:hypothetical protein